MSEGGAIVTVASVAAHTGVPHHMHYAAAKAGLINLTKSAARAFAPRLRVNCVAPGITLTPMGKIQQRHCLRIMHGRNYWFKGMPRLKR